MNGSRIPPNDRLRGPRRLHLVADPAGPRTPRDSASPPSTAAPIVPRVSAVATSTGAAPTRLFSLSASARWRTPERRTAALCGLLTPEALLAPLTDAAGENPSARFLAEHRVVVQYACSPTVDGPNANWALVSAQAECGTRSHRVTAHLLPDRDPAFDVAVLLDRIALLAEMEPLQCRFDACYAPLRALRALLSDRSVVPAVRRAATNLYGTILNVWAHAETIPLGLTHWHQLQQRGLQAPGDLWSLFARTWPIDRVHVWRVICRGAVSIEFPTAPWRDSLSDVMTTQPIRSILQTPLRVAPDDAAVVAATQQIYRAWWSVRKQSASSPAVALQELLTQVMMAALEQSR